MTTESQMPTGKNTRIVLADDHYGMCEMLSFILRLEPGMEVVGEAKGGCEALRVCRVVKPDVVVLDLAMPDLAGVHVMHSLRESAPGIRVLIYTGTENEAAMRAVLMEKPDGFVRKTEPLSELRTAIRTVSAGGRYLSPFAEKLSLRPDAMLSILTEKEVAVLQMIARGMLTKEIAEVLDAKPKTIDHHRQHLMDKLGLHDVASLTRFAIHAGLC